MDKISPSPEQAVAELRSELETVKRDAELTADRLFRLESTMMTDEQKAAAWDELKARKARESEPKPPSTGPVPPRNKNEPPKSDPSKDWWWGD